MAGYLTTHVLDTARGCPAAGIKIALYRLTGDAREKIAESVTNADGRTDAPILPQDAFEVGTYELVFFASEYLRSECGIADDPLFLGEHERGGALPCTFVALALWVFDVSGELREDKRNYVNFELGSFTRNQGLLR